MDILFVNPAVSAEAIYGKRFKKLGATQPPLGMCYIAAYLAKHGITSEILDANFFHYSSNEVCKNIKKYSPPVIGLYATTMGYNKVKQLAYEIKRNCGDIPIVLGGPHVQAVGQDSVKESCFDFGVMGEGEITVHEFITALKDGKDLSEINGLLLKKDGQIIVNSKRILNKNLDDLPFPARDKLQFLTKYHLKAMITKYKPATHMLTSRGCPFSCIFCNHIFGRNIRYHSPEYVVGEMEELVYKYGMREIAINDDTFLINHKRVFRICELIKERKLKVTWSCLMNVKNITLDVLKVIKDAGCWLIQPGIESGNQEILKIIDKPVVLEEALRVSKWAREVGLMVKPSFILGHPTETKETIEQTINFAIKMKAHYPAFALMTPFPGTRLWDEAEKYGTFDKSDFDKLIPSSSASFVPYGLNEKYLKAKQLEAYRRCYLRPDMIARHILTIKGWTDVRKMFHAAIALLT